MHIQRKKEEEDEGGSWRHIEGGRDEKKGRADPVRSAASLVDL